MCRKALTKKEYERALGILEARKAHVEHEMTDLRTRLRDAKAGAKRARREGVETERTRVHRLLAGKQHQIQGLKERIRQLERGTTPATEGLEFEGKLAARLAAEFPTDDIRDTGKAGDILQTVKSGSNIAGVIVYECKRRPTIDASYVRQAQEAKRSRQADFAVLVTTGRRRGFGGLQQYDGVLAVAPLGVVSLAHLLRTHLIELLRAGITRAKRAIVARQLLDYITSPQFKGPIREAVERVEDLERIMVEEVHDHVRTWKRRAEHYVNIKWSSEQIRASVAAVLGGQKPKVLPRTRPTPLALPAPKAGH